MVEFEFDFLVATVDEFHHFAVGFSFRHDLHIFFDGFFGAFLVGEEDFSVGDFEDLAFAVYCFAVEDHFRHASDFSCVFMFFFGEGDGLRSTKE